jgi:ribonuclease HI
MSTPPAATPDPARENEAGPPDAPLGPPRDAADVPNGPVVDGAMPVVELFTDGACSGNPGPGGWAYLLKHPASGRSRERAGGDRDTTNNRMELTAVIEGLKALQRRSRVELYSDSKYVLDGLNNWIHAWKKKGWRTASKQPVKNVDLWRELDALRNKHVVAFHWVQGHAGHEENERVDTLAVEQRDLHA